MPHDGEDWERIQGLGLRPGVDSLEKYEELVASGTERVKKWLPNVEPERILSKDFIELVHYEIFREVHPWAGQLRSSHLVPGHDGNVKIRYIEPPKWQDVEKHLQSLEQFGDVREGTFKDRLSTIAAFHAEFEAIHPFLDGNGRVGREIMAAQMQHAFGRKPEGEIDKVEYSRGLLAAQAAGSPSRLETQLCVFAGVQTEIELEKASFPEKRTDEIWNPAQRLSDVFRDSKLPQVSKTEFERATLSAGVGKEHWIESLRNDDETYKAAIKLGLGPEVALQAALEEKENQRESNQDKLVKLDAEAEEKKARNDRTENALSVNEEQRRARNEQAASQEKAAPGHATTKGESHEH